MKISEIINESVGSYEDRVNQVADYVINMENLGRAESKEILLRRIEHTAKKFNVPEAKFSDSKTSNAWKEFTKDVIVKLKGKLTRDTSAVDNKNEKLQKISRIIQDEVSNSFPDADPWDAIVPRVKKLGISQYEIMDWLDKATRKYLGGKSYSNYLETVSDDFRRDNP